MSPADTTDPVAPRALAPLLPTEGGGTSALFFADSEEEQSK